MTVGELMEILSKIDPNTMVEVNDNRNGEVHSVEQVDFFEETDLDFACCMIQVNC